MIGTSSAPLPLAAFPICELMTTVLAPRGPGATWVAADAAALERIELGVAAAPRAAATLAEVLRVTSQVGVVDGIAAESHAYSMLLASEEFARWRASRPSASLPPEGDMPVRMERDGDLLRVVLDRPRRRNAFGRAVRDGMLDAIDLAMVDASIAQVELSGAGPCFCSGGDLDEFGTARDVGEAHRVRMRAHAGLALSRLAERLTVRVHGACIGAGVELPAFANRVVARDGTWFQLPELAMGLIPGAGGTVSLTRRIGRWRTAYLALTGDRLDLATGLAWGLVDERE